MDLKILMVQTNKQRQCFFYIYIIDEKKTNQISFIHNFIIK